MVVVGSGAIGVEFAYFYNAIGTEVTVVEYVDRRAVGKESPSSSTPFKKAGINIMTNSSHWRRRLWQGLQGDGEDKGEETLECDVVLSAAGVVSNIENIGLEECGIVHDRSEIVVNDYYATNIGTTPSATAFQVRPRPRGVGRRHHLCREDQATAPNPSTTATSPVRLLPRSGERRHDGRRRKEAGHEIKVGKFPFSASGKAGASGHKDGFVKLIFDAKYSGSSAAT